MTFFVSKIDYFQVSYYNHLVTGDYMITARYDAIFEQSLLQRNEDKGCKNLQMYQNDLDSLFSLCLKVWQIDRSLY